MTRFIRAAGRLLRRAFQEHPAETSHRPLEVVDLIDLELGGREQARERAVRSSALGGAVRL